MTSGVSAAPVPAGLSAPPGSRSGAWLERPGFGVYVHIPFCTRRCHYCDFNTYEGQGDLHSAYVDALIRDIETSAPPSRRATSVFFGGGTPTLLRASELARILKAVERAVGIAPGAEVTVEANPETVDEAMFEALLGAGFNRFSIGMQSLVPHVLRGLGRTHGAAAALEALAAARRAGAGDVNADLIYGSPWETPDDWTISLNGIVDAAPDHISAYALTVEEGTPLGVLVASRRVDGVDPDVQADRFEVAEAVLGAAGYDRYEISNWARPGRASRHNVLYWSAGDYLAFGAGAHGHLGGRRWWSVKLPRDFVARVASGRPREAGFEVLGADERAGEALMLGLRLRRGVDLEGFRRRFGPDAVRSRGAAVATLVEEGLLERCGGRLRLAPGATLLANEVASRLL